MAPPSSAVALWSQYLGARLGYMGLSLGDVESSTRLARRLGRWVYALDAKHRRRAIEHIAMAFPQLSEAQVDDLARRSFDHFTRLLVEICLTPRLFHANNWSSRVRLGPVDAAAEWLNSGKPAIMVTGHLGNWEVLGYLLAILGYPMHAVARPLDNPKINDWLLGIRETRGMRILTKWNATDRMVQVLENGGVLGFIADQNAGVHGTFVPYFGRLASTYKSIALLAVRMNVPVFCGYAHRIGPAMDFEVGVSEVIRPEDWTDCDDPVFYVTARYMRAIETLVRRRPEQYLWMHRRWRTRPRFERAGKAMPPSLRQKLQALPWLTPDDLQQLGAG